MATLRKIMGGISPEPEYEVIQHGKTIGYFSRYYEKSTGRWAAGLVGHSPGGFFWEFYPIADNPGFFNGTSFKEGKKRLQKEYPG